MHATYTSDFPQANGLSVSSVGTADDSKNKKDGETATVAKSLQVSHLSTDKAHMSLGNIDCNANTPGRTRTCDLRIRNPLLYPTELRALLT